VSLPELDAELTRWAATEVRASWLTPLLVVLSAWWVKGPLLALLAAARPATAARRLAAAATVGLAALLGSLAASLVKVLVARERPSSADGADALVALPDTYAFPSGHATTAGAAAAALALLDPRLRVPAALVAVGVAASRVLLGVHFVGDVLAGLVLGALVGAAVVRATGRWRRPARPEPTDASGTLPGRGRVDQPGGRARVARRRAGHRRARVGGALGLAVLATLSASRSAYLTAGGTPAAEALVGGYHLAFWIGAGLVGAAILVAVTVLRPVTPAAA
jgi:membrane-associated phospholipid phosphatase